MHHTSCYKKVEAALRRHQCWQTLALWRGKPASTWPNRVFYQPARKSEAGVALILAMLVILVLTVLASSIIFVTQSQVWTSFNYRLTTQCRYAAEGGVQQTMNWLQNVYVPPAYNAIPPAAPGTPPFTGFDVTQDPVKCNDPSCSTIGGDVVLWGDPTLGTSNYPVAAMVTSFQGALGNKPVDPISNLSYSTSAKLMAMTPLKGAFPGITANAIQIWQVTSVGTYRGAVRNAQVQLVVTYQRMLVSATANALYGTNNACPTITLNGGSSVTQSYNSSAGAPVTPNLQNSGGNVGSNGGLSLIGLGATVNGNFSASPTDPCAPPTPNPPAGPGLNGSNITVPVQIPYPVPTAPVPLPPDGPIVTINGSAIGGCPTLPPLVGCTDLGAKHVALAGGTLAAPALYGNLSFGGGIQVDVTAPGVYNVNSVAMAGSSSFNVVSAASPAPPTGPVVFNVAGQSTTGGANFASAGPPAIVFDLGGGTIVNNYPPGDFNVNYGGTYGIKIHGGVSCGAVVYAPAAPVTLVGASSTFYGSIIGATVNDSNVAVIYDRALGTGFYIAGNYVPMGFSWSSF